MYILAMQFVDDKAKALKKTFESFLIVFFIFRFSTDGDLSGKQEATKKVK